MKMFIDILKISAVICLTFSSMVQMSAIPELTIIAEMRKELSNCSFPPAEALRKGNISSRCSQSKPILSQGQPLSVDLMFSFGKYLCMELYDLSLQLCSNNIVGDKFPTSEESFDRISHGQNLTSFCDKLQFPNSHADKTSQWASIAVEALKNRTLCESNCIKLNSLDPVCGAIAWASELLIYISQKQLTLDKLESQADVHSNQEQVTIEAKPEASNTPTVKDEIATRTSNNSLIQIKVNEIVRNNEESSKGEIINPGVQVPDKNVPVASSTPIVLSTSTVSSVILDTPNIEKDEDHEEDISAHSSRIGLGDSITGDDGRSQLGDDMGNMGPKGSNTDVFSPEGYADEDTQSGVSSSDGHPRETSVYRDTFVDAQDSHFFAYFLTMVVICIVGYLLFHNKQKIIALALEGRRMQGSRRRPNTSSYKKLDSNLEEAVTSTCSSSSVTHVIF